MTNSVLDCEQLSVVIIGNGTVGMSLAEQLLRRDNLVRLMILSRSPIPAPSDPRVVDARLSIDDPQTLLAAAGQFGAKPLHLVINTVGLLHGPALQPEKRLSELTLGNMQQSFAANAMLLPLIAQAFGPLLKHGEPAMLASLSARVGSIEDNQMGGWYSYRASKAAHNMLLKTLAREWRVSHKNVAVVALHPGTVQSRLSEPFVTARYRNRVLAGEESAEALLAVIGGLNAKDTGSFLDWQGKAIPW